MNVVAIDLSLTSSGWADADGHGTLVPIRSLGYTGHSHDAADAVWLRTMALAHYAPTCALTQKQSQAIASVEWPALNLTVGDIRS